MNRKQLIEHVSQQAELSKQEADAALNAIVDVITVSLSKQESVTLMGFGSFNVTQRAARTGRNPATGEEIKVAAARFPIFKAAQALKAKVNV